MTATTDRTATAARIDAMDARLTELFGAHVDRVETAETRLAAYRSNEGIALDGVDATLARLTAAWLAAVDGETEPDEDETDEDVETFGPESLGDLWNRAVDAGSAAVRKAGTIAGASYGNLDRIADAWDALTDAFDAGAPWADLAEVTAGLGGGNVWQSAIDALTNDRNGQRRIRFNVRGGMTEHTARLRGMYEVTPVVAHYERRNARATVYVIRVTGEATIEISRRKAKSGTVSASRSRRHDKATVTGVAEMAARMAAARSAKAD